MPLFIQYFVFRIKKYYYFRKNIEISALIQYCRGSHPVKYFRIRLNAYIICKFSNKKFLV